MAKSKRKSPKKKQAAAKPKITMKDIEAMSDSDDDGSADVALNSKAMELKRIIESGQFDQLLDKQKDDDESESEIEEVVLGDDDNDDDADDADDDNNDNDDVSEEEDEEEEADSMEDKGEDEGENEEEELDQSEEAKKARAFLAGGAEPNDDDDSDDENSDGSDNEDDEKKGGIRHRNALSSKALTIVTKELKSQKAGVPWPETFDVLSSEPLPFGRDPTGNPLDVHDDLKREVIFYNMALDAVKQARVKCRDAKIPFSRPDDFFAEMVKTDEHMARVKDRLIFEGKKIDAVAQRKSNKEQKLRSKESHANKLVEKAKRKRDHFKQVEDWAKSAAQNRGNILDDDADDQYLQRMGGGANKKRQAANRKYGFGGKRGRFKQNDRSTLNDTSSFNPRGNFAGGMKKSGGGSGGANRKGKRARDASRARRS
mmetsp:Transcript_17922/g.49711  ORF Transcript_17922/g.49711 Transcript_17922/m.49711 type:complete len:428 (-) Transcript_17922:1657-2940(-)|eukprot:CAMPEP_0198132372 /NCGR_PEP_ID=MMETSP1442-20131203/58200_1 /TAXON_ID= /ORGANISM="Craspedostauros australis, Strain CCMP3328" /LENGTH=427 /DNA_ID=CAMNT_0043793365 /DNA_START=58 /DNA_END=1341 /DNA_ORIENTATION=+